VLDQKAQKLMWDTEDAHAEAEACVEACSRLQEDLVWLVSDVSRRELAVEGPEQELQEKEAESAHKLERENDLSTHEATMEVEW
jgi:hypothetical protein